MLRFIMKNCEAAVIPLTQKAKGIKSSLDLLKVNITAGNGHQGKCPLIQVCKISKVTEFKEASLLFFFIVWLASYNYQLTCNFLSF